ncbi:hypothetical protein WSS_A21958 [Rhodococcus opacus M213]|uniref:Uncharacterized protein n=2 Tax=Rhodococcus opacus TaxID=37919 RepID=K8XGI6_RHOOP|nr:hypothetical protein WSS_A21958 [Rhodococcus opacus M213]
MDLSRIDLSIGLMSNPFEVAAFTMRKLQLLYAITHPKEITTNGVAMTLLVDLHRSIDQLEKHCDQPSRAALHAVKVKISQGLVDVGEMNRDVGPSAIIELGESEARN